MDPSITPIKKLIKMNWIKALTTAYPKGLNNQVGDDYREDKTEFVGLTVPYLTKTNSRNTGIQYNYVHNIWEQVSIQIK